MGICHGKWVEADVVPLFCQRGIQVDFAKRGFVDLINQPASLNNRGGQGQSSMPACGLALAYNTFFPISFSARRCEFVLVEESLCCG